MAATLIRPTQRLSFHNTAKKNCKTKSAAQIKAMLRAIGAAVLVSAQAAEQSEFQKYVEQAVSK